MPFTGNPVTSAIDRVRLMTGDILANDYLADDVYQFVLDKNVGAEKASAVECARYILATLAPHARQRAGDIEYYGAEYFKNYKEYLLLLIQNPHMGFLAAMPYASGISVKDIQSNNNNHDNYRPSFLDYLPSAICSDLSKYYWPY
jgi:hypothetical protein